MSATADFHEEIDEAMEYMASRFSGRDATISFSEALGYGEIRVGVGGGSDEYVVTPIPRKDYARSRRMRGWRVRFEGMHPRRRVPTGRILALFSRSYEAAAALIEKDAGWEKQASVMMIDLLEKRVGKKRAREMVKKAKLPR
jgi:hypothetical protein